MTLCIILSLLLLAALVAIQSQRVDLRTAHVNAARRADASDAELAKLRSDLSRSNADRDALLAQADVIDRAYENADHEPPCITTLTRLARTIRSRCVPSR